MIEINWYQFILYNVVGRTDFIAIRFRRALDQIRFNARWSVSCWCLCCTYENKSEKKVYQIKRDDNDYESDFVGIISLVFIKGLIFHKNLILWINRISQSRYILVLKRHSEWSMIICSLYTIRNNFLYKKIHLNVIDIYNSHIFQYLKNTSFTVGDDSLGR